MISGGLIMKRICGALVVFSLTAFLLLTTVPVASAQQAGPFYVGVLGGFVAPDDLEVTKGGGSSRDIDVDDSWAIGAKFGYIIPQLKWLAAELEYTYLAKQDYGATISNVERYDGDFAAHNVMANVLFRYPQGKIHPYVGFGLGISTATLEETTLGGVSVYNYDDDDTAFASQFIAGVNFEIAPNISADLAYKYFYSEYDFNDYYGIDTDVEAGNHLFTAGINFHF